MDGKAAEKVEGGSAFLEICPASFQDLICKVKW